MEFCPFHGHATSTTTNTSTATSTAPCISAAVKIAKSTPPRYEPAHMIRHWISIIDISSFFWSPFLTRFNSQFSIRLDSILVLIWLDSFFIWFDSHLTYLFSIRLTQLESHSVQASGIPTLDMVSSKYSNTKIVEYSMILIIDIVFGDNTLTKSKNQRR